MKVRESLAMESGGLFERDEVDPLVRELWEAHATMRQAVMSFPALHWDEADASERNHWRALARVALAFMRSPE